MLRVIWKLTRMGIVLVTISLIVCLSMRPVVSGNSQSLRGLNEAGSFNGLLINNMKKEIHPCEDFYKHMCGKWMDTVVPYGVPTWTLAEERTTSMKAEVAKYLEKKLTNKNIYPVKWAKMFFKACMDESMLNEIGVHPLANIVNVVGGGEWDIFGESSANAWVAIHKSYFRRTGKGALFTIEVGPDENANRNVLIISPMEQLSLRDISKSSGGHRSQYEEFLSDIWTAYPKERDHTYSPQDVKDAIKAVLRFREAMRQKRNQIRIAPKMTTMTLSELQVHTRRYMHIKHLDWLRLLQSTFKGLRKFKFDESTVVHIRQLDYLNIILSAIESTSVRVLLNHIHFHFLEKFIQYTSFGMTALSYHVFHRPLPERSIICVSSNPMKKIVNYIYVKKFLTEQVISEATTLTRNVEKTLTNEILRTEWIDIETARAAVYKIKEIKYAIGYDDWYKHEKNVIAYYDKMSITTDYFNTILDFETMTYQNTLQKLWMPVRNRLNRPLPDPLDVYAAYNYQTNTLVIPAALLQKPFLSPNMLPQTTLGGVGTIVGHILSRSFDSLGRQYDAMGHQRNWWRADTQNEYKKRLRCYVRRFKEAIAREFPTAEVNFAVDRNHYLDEIVAEYMGLVASYETYRRIIRSVIEDPKNVEEVNEIDINRVFFAAYVTRQCEAIDTHYFNVMGTDAPLPYRLRVNTALSNMQAFADVFNCEVDDPMSSPEKCEWLDESGIPPIESEAK